MTSWTSVCISVADMDETLDLWSGAFGLEILAQKDGDDPELERWWDLKRGDISRQALLGTPGASTGLVHIVEFSDPGLAVRDGANVFDLCLKNLDIYVQDLPSRFKELKAAGRTFRSENLSILTAPDGTVFREVHMHGHDAINIVLLEIIGEELPFTSKGYTGIGPVVTTVANADVERKFYREVMGLDKLHDNILEGPEIERMIGLPPGSALDVSIWGTSGESLGQIEVVEYRGVKGNNLYSRAVPKQRGALHITYRTDDLQNLKGLLDKAGITWTDGGYLSILSGTGQFIRFHSPTGLKIEVFEPIK